MKSQTHVRSNSTLSRIISYYGLTVNILVKKRSSPELLSSFMHHLYKPLYTPMRCKRCRLVLRTPFAKCEPPRSNLRSLADEQARRLISLDYRFLVPFRFRLHSKSLILLCGRGVSAWCDAPTRIMRATAEQSAFTRSQASLQPRVAPLSLRI